MYRQDLGETYHEDLDFEEEELTELLEEEEGFFEGGNEVFGRQEETTELLGEDEEGNPFEEEIDEIDEGIELTEGEAAEMGIEEGVEETKEGFDITDDVIDDYFEDVDIFEGGGESIFDKQAETDALLGEGETIESGVELVEGGEGAIEGITEAGAEIIGEEVATSILGTIGTGAVVVGEVLLPVAVVGGLIYETIKALKPRKPTDPKESGVYKANEQFDNLKQYQKILFNDPLKFDKEVIDYSDLSKTQKMAIRVMMEDENKNGIFDKQLKYLNDGGTDLSIIDKNGKMTIVKPLNSLELKHIERQIKQNPELFMGQDRDHLEALGLNPDLSSEYMKNPYVSEKVLDTQVFSEAGLNEIKKSNNLMTEKQLLREIIKKNEDESSSSYSWGELNQKHKDLERFKTEHDDHIKRLIDSGLDIDQAKRQIYKDVMGEETITERKPRKESDLRAIKEAQNQQTEIGEGFETFDAVEIETETAPETAPEIEN